MCALINIFLLVSFRVIVDIFYLLMNDEPQFLLLHDLVECSHELINDLIRSHSFPLRIRDKEFLAYNADGVFDRVQ